MSKTLGAGFALGNPVFLIGLGLIAAGLALSLGIWQFYLWQSKEKNARYDRDEKPEDLAANHSAPQSFG